MVTDSIQQLEQQITALLNYCAQLKQENAKLRERNRLVSSKLQKIAAQLKALEDSDV